MAAPPTSVSFLTTRKGRLTLALLASIGFLDFADSAIVNIALPDIRSTLHFSVQGLQWVLSGYLLTYGGFMLLGGRLADLLGRRRVLLAGTALFAASSLTGGFASDAAMLVGSRFAQGLGAALMMPAALSLLTTMFHAGTDRTRAVGVWGGVAGLASAAGVFLGGLLTEGPGWRWVLFVNPPIAALLLVGIMRLLPDERPAPRTSRNFDVIGSVLVTGGMVLLVYALVKASDQGWGSAKTVLELVAAGVLLVAFLFVERIVANPLIPLDVFGIKGLAAADTTNLVAVAGMAAMFFFLTLYMQNILGFSPLQTASSYLPLTAAVGASAAAATALINRVGNRPVMLAGLVITGGGLIYLSRMPVNGHYVSDLLPGLLIAGTGLGAAFVGITTAGNASVPADKAGLAAALLNAAQQVGGALGLAVLSAISAARTQHLLGAHESPHHADAAGFHRALFVGALIVLGSIVVALRTRNTRAEQEHSDHPDAVSGGPQARLDVTDDGGVLSKI